MKAFCLVLVIIANFAQLICCEGETRKKFGPKEVKILIESQDKIKEKVRQILKLEEKRLEQIKTLLEQPNIPAPKDGYSNPLINFRIIKNFVRSELFEKLRYSPVDDVFTKSDAVLPDYWDMEKVGLSVLKMSEKKKLTPKEMADNAPEGPYTYEDCFHVGRMAYNTKDYHHAALWMEESWNRMIDEKGIAAKDKIPVLDFWSFSLYQEGNLERAYWLTKEILKLDPEHIRVKENLPYYEEEMKEKKIKPPKSEKDLPPVKYSSKEQKKKQKEL